MYSKYNKKIPCWYKHGIFLYEIYEVLSYIILIHSFRKIFYQFI